MQVDDAGGDAGGDVEVEMYVEDVRGHPKRETIKGHPSMGVMEE